MNKTLTLAISLLALISLTSAYDYCSSGDQGNRLEISSITDNLQDNTKTFSWEEHQQISMTIKVKNKLEYVEDFNVEIIFLDTNSKEVSIIEDDDDLEKEFTLKNGDTEELNFKFRLEDDVTSGTYYMYVKYYVDGEESRFCKQTKKDITIGSLNKCSSNSKNIEITGFKDNKEDNSNSWEWENNDDISLDFYIKNKAATQDFDITLKFFNDDEEIIEVASENDLEESTTLSQNDEEKVSFDFNINKVSNGDYGVYINVISEDDNSFCYSKRLSGNGDNTFISIEDDDKIKVSILGNLEVTANSNEEYKVTVKNTGSKTQKKVYVAVYSKGVPMQKQITENLLSNESRTLKFDVNIPNRTGAEAVIFRIEYDYDDEYDSYEVYKKIINIKEQEVKQEVKIEASEDKPQEVVKQEVVNDSTQEEEGLEEAEEERSYFWIIVVVLIILIVIGIFVWNKLRRGENE